MAQQYPTHSHHQHHHHHHHHHQQHIHRDEEDDDDDDDDDNLALRRVSSLSLDVSLSAAGISALEDSWPPPSLLNMNQHHREHLLSDPGQPVITPTSSEELLGEVSWEGGGPAPHHHDHHNDSFRSAELSYELSLHNPHTTDGDDDEELDLLTDASSLASSVQEMHTTSRRSPTSLHHWTVTFPPDFFESARQRHRSLSPPHRWRNNPKPSATSSPPRQSSSNTAVGVPVWDRLYHDARERQDRQLERQRRRLADAGPPQSPSRDVPAASAASSARTRGAGSSVYTPRPGGGGGGCSSSSIASSTHSHRPGSVWERLHQDTQRRQEKQWERVRRRQEEEAGPPSSSVYSLPTTLTMTPTTGRSAPVWERLHQDAQDRRDRQRELQHEQWQEQQQQLPASYHRNSTASSAHSRSRSRRSGVESSRQSTYSVPATTMTHHTEDEDDDIISQNLTATASVTTAATTATATPRGPTKKPRRESSLERSLSRPARGDPSSSTTAYSLTTTGSLATNRRSVGGSTTNSSGHGTRRGVVPVWERLQQDVYEREIRQMERQVRRAQRENLMMMNHQSLPALDCFDETIPTSRRSRSVERWTPLRDLSLKHTRHRSLHQERSLSLPPTLQQQQQQRRDAPPRVSHDIWRAKNDENVLHYNVPSPSPRDATKTLLQLNHTPIVSNSSLDVSEDAMGVTYLGDLLDVSEHDDDAGSIRIAGLSKHLKDRPCYIRKHSQQQLVTSLSGGDSTITVSTVVSSPPPQSDASVAARLADDSSVSSVATTRTSGGSAVWTTPQSASGLPPVPSSTTAVVPHPGQSTMPSGLPQFTTPLRSNESFHLKNNGSFASRLQQHRRMQQQRHQALKKLHPNGLSLEAAVSAVRAHSANSLRLSERKPDKMKADYDLLLKPVLLPSLAKHDAAATTLQRWWRRRRVLSKHNPPSVPPGTRRVPLASEAPKQRNQLHLSTTSSMTMSTISSELESETVVITPATARTISSPFSSSNDLQSQSVSTADDTESQGSRIKRKQIGTGSLSISAVTAPKMGDKNGVRKDARMTDVPGSVDHPVQALRAQYDTAVKELWNLRREFQETTTDYKVERARLMDDKDIMYNDLKELLCLQDIQSTQLSRQVARLERKRLRYRVAIGIFLLVVLFLVRRMVVNNMDNNTMSSFCAPVRPGSVLNAAPRAGEVCGEEKRDFFVSPWWWPLHGSKEAVFHHVCGTTHHQFEVEFVGQTLVMRQIQSENDSKPPIVIVESSCHKVWMGKESIKILTTRGRTKEIPAPWTNQGMASAAATNSMSGPFSVLGLPVILG